MNRSIPVPVRHDATIPRGYKGSPAMSTHRRPEEHDKRRILAIYQQARDDANPEAALEGLVELIERLRKRAHDAMLSADRRAEQSWEIGESVARHAVEGNPRLENSDHASNYFKRAIRNKLSSPSAVM